MTKFKNFTKRKIDGKLPENKLPTPSIETQQLMLNVFRDSFSNCIYPAWSNLIQEVKGLLFNRNFNEAFGRPELLEAYATRWSPTRALAYLDVLTSTPSLAAHMAETVLPAMEYGRAKGSVVGTTLSTSPDSQLDSPLSNNRINPKDKAGTIDCKSIVCIGAGSGAEIVALAGFMHHKCASISEDTLAAKRSPFSNVEDSLKPSLTVRILDVADWSSVMEKLYSIATNIPLLSEYASSSAKAKHAPLIGPEMLNITFERQDVLSMEVESLAIVLNDVSLVTMMFTLNELYSASMSKATNLLLTMTYLMQPGSLLLVVDSPGSYSVVDLKKVSEPRTSGASEPEKRYPMHWLLDHTLLESSNIGSSKNTSAGAQWEKLVSCDSKWFRLPKELKYPLELEDMRYQLHIYRHL